MNPAIVLHVLQEHAGCSMNESSEMGSAATGKDVWSCGIQLDFVDDLEAAERGHLALAIASSVEGPVLEEIEHRVERLEEVEARWDVPGGSPRLAQRARDKIAGLEVAYRLIVGDAR